jgi:hypothetical protein
MMQKMASCVRRTEYRMHKQISLQIPIKMMRQSRYHTDMMRSVGLADGVPSLLV